MSRSVEDGEHQHGVCQLSVKPEVLVERQEANLGSDPSHDGSADGEQDEHAIDTEDQTSTSRNPDGKLQGVQTR